MQGRGSLMQGRGSLMQGRGSPVDRRSSLVDGRGSLVDGRGSLVDGRGSPVPGRGLGARPEDRRPVLSADLVGERSETRTHVDEDLARPDDVDAEIVPRPLARSGSGIGSR